MSSFLFLFHTLTEHENDFTILNSSINNCYVMDFFSGKGTRIETIEKILPMLQDIDRLVRESAVLSLGKLKAENCVKAIIDRW